MIVDPIKNGIVLDHIKAGTALSIYKTLHLEELTCAVAIVTNAESVKMGKKDIIKVDEVIDLDFDVLGYLDSGITVNIIENGVLIKRNHLDLPETVQNVIACKNPRCITAQEKTLTNIFKLTNRAEKTYRCMYCDSASFKFEK
jgi:aspartate carbamoyltransferase regulatory subunit